MHRTIGLTGYIGPLSLTSTLVRSSVSPIVRSNVTDGQTDGRHAISIPRYAL